MIRLERLEEKINSLDISMQEIKYILKHNVSPNCQKMEQHITFVDSVYAQVKYPLEVVCNSVSRLMHKPTVPLLPNK